MIGRTVGNYLIERKLGEGGMGAVYLARHPRIGKEVAVKVLLPHMSRDPELVQRFFHEAKAAAEIKNAHIVDVLDFGELPDGASYIIMEWLEGRSLADLLQKARKLPLPRAQKIARGIGRALMAAHARGIVHRDLKPDNIFLVTRDDDAEFVKVLDFGIAKLMTTDVKTQAGAILGTPHYMSPEQCQGAPVDARADVYSLGVILYQMVTGRLPFQASSFAEMLVAHLHKPPPPPRTIDPSLPPSIEEALLQALAKDPEQRFSRVEALVTAFSGDGGLDARTPAPLIPATATVATQPMSERSRRGLLVAAAAIALIVIGLLVRVARAPTQNDTPPTPPVVAVAGKAPEPVAATVEEKPAKHVSKSAPIYGGTWALSHTDCPAGWMPLLATVVQTGGSFVVQALGFPPTGGEVSADGHFSTKNAAGHCHGQVTGRVSQETCTNWLKQSCHATYRRAD